jgi:Arc/MetJ-type ribon-helix-helix transcriptional regulator
MKIFIPSMKKVTVSLEEEQIELLEKREETGSAGSRSEAVRQILSEYEGLHTEYEELLTEYEDLHTRLESREDRIDELEEQLARRSQVEEKVDTLAKRVEDDDAPFFIRWYRWYQNRD